MDNIQYNYPTYHIDLRTLHKRVEESGVKYDLIVGVVRGGLIPATHLSHLLEVPLATLMWSSSGVRDSSNQHITTALSSGKRVLVVDDIIDDGTTARGI
jgi:hypoxanthine phosphoribosyltransferase